MGETSVTAKVVNELDPKISAMRKEITEDLSKDMRRLVQEEFQLQKYKENKKDSSESQESAEDEAETEEVPEKTKKNKKTNFWKIVRILVISEKSDLGTHSDKHQK